MVSLALALCALASTAPAQGRWELLGRREVDFGRDRDRVTVGKQERGIKELQIRVQGAPIELYDMVVTFANGQTFSPELRHRFTEGSASRVIDLPGERRTIRYVDFLYRSTDPRAGRATVLVWSR